MLLKLNLSIRLVKIEVARINQIIIQLYLENFAKKLKKLLKKYHMLNT